MTAEFSSARKEKRKRLRTGIEFLILAVLVVFSFAMLFSFKRYRAWNAATASTDDSDPLALLFPGVGRLQTENSLDTESLDALLGELRSQGYVSVSQEDADAHYAEGMQLPARSVVLIFGDGKRDTAELAQPILEKYNYQATMLKSDEDAQKEQYLSERDERTLTKSTFWEIGMDDTLLDTLEPLTVDPCWSVNHLLLEIGAAEDESEEDALLSSALPGAMTLQRGYAQLTENRLTLTTDEEGVGKIRILPEQTFTDAHIKAEFCGDSEGTQQIGMRVRKKDGVYIRVTDHRIQLWQKKNGQMDMIDAMDLTQIKKDTSDGYAADIRLSGTGLTVYVNSRIVFNNTKVSVTEPGGITLTARSEVNRKKTDDRIYDAEFCSFFASGDGEVLFDGSMKWYQSLFHSLKELKRSFTAWVQQTGQ